MPRVLVSSVSWRRGGNTAPISLNKAWSVWHIGPAPQVLPGPVGNRLAMQISRQRALRVTWTWGQTSFSHGMS